MSDEGRWAKDKMKRVVLAISLLVLVIAAVFLYPVGKKSDYVFRTLTGEAIRVRMHEQRVVDLEFDYAGRTYVAPAHALSELDAPVFPEARVSSSRPFEKLPTVCLSLPVKLQPGDRVIGTNAAYLFAPDGEFRRLAFDRQVTKERLADEVRRQREKKMFNRVAGSDWLPAPTPPDMRVRIRRFRNAIGP